MDSEPELEGNNDRRGERGEQAGTYGELCVPGLQDIICEQLPVHRARTARRPTPLELEILAALWSHGFLLADQIWGRWWPQRTRRWAYHELKHMTQAGWVDRYRLIVAGGGSQQRFYGLAEGGFELARGRRLRERQGIPRDASWLRRVVDRTGGLPRELHVNGWVLAIERLAGERMTGWRGAGESRVLPPPRRVRGEWIELRPAEIVLGTNHRLSGYQANVLEAVNPHATIELQLGDRTRVDFMIEYGQQHDDPFEVQERLWRYDLFLSGWAHLLDRYRPPARVPIVVFVCPDQEALASMLDAADRALTTRIAKAGTPDRDWPFPGRRSILFALEPDIHEGSLRAFGVPQDPSGIRATSGVRPAREEPRQVQLIDKRPLPEPSDQVGNCTRRARPSSRSARRNR
jgi:hypothetical protein